MTFASNPSTEARYAEWLGRMTMTQILDTLDGSPQSKLNYFRAGVNEILVTRQLPTLEVVVQKLNARARVSRWSCFLYILGIRNTPSLPH